MAKAIVIGAGFGGIASALRLRAKGYDVTLIDKQDKLGGRATQYRRETPLGTFVHDAGPTVITAKFLFDELFELFGKKREDYVEFRDIYPWYRIVFAGEVTKPQRGTGFQPVSSPADTGYKPVPQKTDLPFFDYGGTLEQFEAQIAKFEPKDVAGFRKFLAHSKKIFDIGFTQLGDQPFDRFTTMLKCAPQLLRLQNYKTVYGMASKYITNESLRRVFSFQPLLVGGNPFNTTSIYSLIFYLERQWGVQFAMGGTGAIVRGLERLMREEGIEIRVGEEVDRIQTVDDRNTNPTATAVHTLSSIGGFAGFLIGLLGGAVGLGMLISFFATGGRWAFFWVSIGLIIVGVIAALGGRILQIAEPEAGFSLGNHFAGVRGVTLKTGETVPADVLVTNADTPAAYKTLIDEDHAFGLAPRRVASMKYSMGLFVLYFGTTKQYPDVAHHTIVLGHEYKALITKLFDTLELETEDLSVYLHRPTATDASMAPPGCESFYCLVPVPNLQKTKRGTGVSPVSAGHGRDAHATDIPTDADGVIDWTRYGDTYKKHVIDYLERTVLPGLSDCIVDDFYVTPKHFEQNLNTLHGTGFSIAPVFSQSAWFRFHNKAPGIEGLYFVGAGTHPGAGMPGVLCSAKVVDRLVPAVTSTSA